MEKKFRVQLTQREIRYIRNLLAKEYHSNRRQLRYERRKPDNPIYSIAEQEKHLKWLAHLLKKLHRYTGFKHRWDAL